MDLLSRGGLALALSLTASCVPVGRPTALGAVAPGRGDEAAPVRLAFDLRGFTDEAPASGDWVRAEMPAARPFVSIDERLQRDLECLTAAVYHEARSEGETGQRAVAQVVLNRVRDPSYPRTVCGVVYQGSDRATGCQFSFTCDGSLRRRRERYAWSAARRIAEEALNGSVYAPVGLATHYHTKAVNPVWSKELKQLASLGAHRFYGW